MLSFQSTSNGRLRICFNLCIAIFFAATLGALIFKCTVTGNSSEVQYKSTALMAVQMSMIPTDVTPYSNAVAGPTTSNLALPISNGIQADA